MPEIGATLREARMRARIDVSEIEAQTKIRAKYLRALENEEWGLLPGPTFVKSFLRTYAQALGLDGRALVEEYRLHHEDGSEQFEPIVSSPRRSGRRVSSGPSRGYVVAVALIAVVIVLLVVLLVTGGSGSSSTHPTATTAPPGASSAARAAHPPAHPRPSTAGVVALSLTASSVDYVCLIGEDGRKLIPGLELQSGESTPTYHARRFEITLGNSSVTMYVDGVPRTVAPSAQPIGYSITKARGRQPLSAAELPTCT
ncbi:MAG TPA: helix-turn-helix domain-containing protein [Solirubrobacteraceae bacterium]|nr:helix-turn-helix domain-containing protein [Solirubrobacteraceae bacterium]